MQLGFLPLAMGHEMWPFVKQTYFVVRTVMGDYTPFNAQSRVTECYSSL